MVKMNFSVTIADIPVQVVRKNIKSIRLAVKSPLGDVRLSVPLRLPEYEIKSLLIRRLSWIKQHQENIRQRPQPQPVFYQTGERHYFQGLPYQLRVVEAVGRHGLVIEQPDQMTLQVRSGTTMANRARVVQDWYRDRLNERVAELVQQWCPVIGKSIEGWQIKRMKTRWGSCNITKRRMTINLALVKRPLECLELVVVHELVHLHERYHNAHFRQLMDDYLPDWRRRQALLDSTSY